MSKANTANASLLAQAGINSVLIGNLLAMMVVALASPLIYYDPEPVTAWLVIWTGPLVFASVLFILAKVLMPARIAQNGQKTFFKYAWVFLALFLFAQWKESGGVHQAQKSALPTVVESAPMNTGPVSRPMTIDEFLADAPATAKPSFQFDPSTARLTDE